MSRETSQAERFWRHLKPLQAALEAYCRRSLWDASAVEDVLQNIVLSALRRFDLFAEGTSFRAWIFRHLHLEIMAANRRAGRDAHAPLADQPVVEGTPLFQDDTPLDESLLGAPQAVLEQCDEALAAAIGRLHPLERSVLLLRAIGGFKYREVAEIVDAPVGTVMSALSRGRSRLRKELAEYARERGFNVGD